MFLLIGISQKEKKLMYDDLVLCKCCGKYGHVELYMTYTYLMLFFVPILKWNKRYFVKMSCCGESCTFNSEVGKAVERGERVGINPEELRFSCKEKSIRVCPNCHFATKEEYAYCPKCKSDLIKESEI